MSCHCPYLLLFAVLGWFAPGAAAEPVAAEARDNAYESGWYRDVRMAMWLWEGAKRERVEAALGRIERGTGQRRWTHLADTQIDHGPGHWTYEFVREGDRAMAARKANKQTYREAAVYYMIASYPHLREPHARAALDKAFDAYANAGELSEFEFEVWTFDVEGVSFSAFAHIPNTSGPHPVVLKTGGMDVLGIEFPALADTLVAEDIAMIAFDMPGNGNDGIVDANAHRHHAAVLERVHEDPRFDAEHIAVWSESLGGLPAVKLAVTHQDYLAAAVNSCGLLHAVHALELAPQPPDFDLESLVSAYRAGQLGDEEIVAIQEALSASPEYQAQTERFQFEVYVQRVGSPTPHVLDLVSRSLPISLEQQGLLGSGTKTGVPLLTINTQSDPLVPVRDSVLATQASRRGTLMLFGDHPGHCVSRELEVPAVLAWLKPYLGR